MPAGEKRPRQTERKQPRLSSPHRVRGGMFSSDIFLYNALGEFLHERRATKDRLDNFTEDRKDENQVYGLKIPSPIRDGFFVFDHHKDRIGTTKNANKSLM